VALLVLPMWIKLVGVQDQATLMLTLRLRILRFRFIRKVAKVRFRHCYNPDNALSV